jgi:hypothetical protein
MTKRKDSVWWKENTTVAAYVSRDVYDALVQMSVERTKTEHEWWSVSRVAREILTKAVLEAEHGRA